MIILETIISILLFILKVIGIILLVVLGLVLLILGTVLFAPIRYKADGQFDMTQFAGRFRITWLLHLISVKVWFEDKKLHYHAKLFGIKIVNSDKIKKKKTTAKEDADNTQKIEKVNEIAVKQDDITDKKITVDDSETVNESVCDDTQNSDENSEADEKVVSDNMKMEEGLDEKRSFIEKLRIKINNIRSKILNICDKIKTVKDIKDRYVEFLTTEESRVAIRDIKEHLFKVLCHIMPVKFRLYLKFGLPDPASTGQVYGIICMLLLRYGNSIDVEPQFEDVEKAFAEGNFKLKGRIRLIVILVHAIKLYTNKRLKEFIAFVKQ